MRCTPVVLIVLFACGKGEGSHDPAPKLDEPRKLAGVYPENFRCDSVATADTLGEVLGGPVKQLDSPSAIPRGVPHPCTYEVTNGQLPEYWTFDFDCRDGFKQRADALFAQYTRTSGELIEQYNIASDAEPPPLTADDRKRERERKEAQNKALIDAGIDAPQRAPEPSVEVPVGAKGLDHHGQGLLFIDDDAPCYVRVVGPNQARRLELSKLIAKNLTFANAPMTPRPFK